MASDNKPLGSDENQGQQYGNVKIVSMEDGTVIDGHEAVEAYFARGRELVDAHGSSLIFQVYRVNMEAESIEAFQGERLTEITVDGGFVTGDDTVAQVKSKLRERIMDGSGSDTSIRPGGQITFFFSGRPMADHSLFYAENPMLLPAWIQVLLHDCEFGELTKRIRELME